MILDLVRTKVAAAHSKIAVLVSFILITGFFVSIPVTAHAAACTSPTTTTVGTDTVVTFTAVESCDWTVPAGVGSVWAVVVGGGGASGAGVSNQWWGAGGGGGQVTSQTISVNSGNTISLSVGAGGATGDGSASSFGSLTANGGKTPTNSTAVGGVSGSGMNGGSGGAGTTGNGGGGAWKAGSGINPGDGISSSITGATVEYGGGGNGYNGGTTTGTARSGAGSLGVAALANRGGGGALLNNAGLRGAGGSGVVIIRYPTPGECSPTSAMVGTDTVLKFTDAGSCSWTPPANISTFQILVVGGGGGGGSNLGGGGGGGQVVSNTSVTITQPTTISVGAGGAGGTGTYATTTNHGKTGGKSRVVSGSINIQALGGSGGNGRMSATNLNPDGSAISTGYTGGGGAYANSPAEIAIAGAGGNSFIGGNGSVNGGGGGGGAGGPGTARGATSNASNGGVGVSSSITGTSTYFGGGGGATWYTSKTGWTGVGGYGGGGNGADGNLPGNDGVANTGGGGGGGYDSTTGGNGGTGIVIIRYALPAGFSILSFDANGGTGSITPSYVSNGGSVTLPDGTGLAKEGYEFNGWNSLANESGTSYSAGSSITISAATTLYAKWLRAPSPSCAAGVGKGGPGTSNYLTTKAGNGCVGISYKVSGVTTVATFNYTGSDQSWTVPTGVTSATFYLIGAGGGGAIYAGGGGGYATGTYVVTPGNVLTVIVGEGGGGAVGAAVTGLPGKYTPLTYGGGGRGGSYGGASSNWYASGGGRSAIRLSNGTEIVTAAGGGGGSYGQCGFGGGGTTGLPTTTVGNSGTGGTQTAGGTGGYSVNSYPGTAGSAFQGGDSKDEGGGGGGGYFGGGGAGDNAGGPGGSSYVDRLTKGLTNPGGNCGAAAIATGLIYVVSYDANGASSGSAPAKSTVPMTGGTLTLANNTGNLVKSGYTFAGWNTAADGSGTNYAVGATTFSPSGDTTLYAQWNATVTYNANGATGTVPAAVVTTGTASRSFTLNAGTGLTRTALNFTGWNTKSDGSGTNYSGGASYTAAGDITLFAIFRPTYTYNANGATGGTVPASTVGPVPGTACIVDPGYTNCKVFSYTGTDQQFTVPTDIDATKGILVEAWGAGGGGTVAYYNDPSGAAGGYSKAKINSPTAGDVLTVVVGQGGLVGDTTVQYGGGGAGGLATGGYTGSSGGGYSGIFTGSTPILISGGGGGASAGSANDGKAGGGGGANQNGGQSATASVGGRGGTSSAGGAGATANSCATAGASLLGGTGCAIAGSEGGSGGGGGYYGGGGGTYQTSTSGTPNGGGGGGSGYLNTTVATLITATAGGDGVIGAIASPDKTSVNYVAGVGIGGTPNTNTVASNSGGNGLITIQWSSPTISSPVASNTGNLSRYGYTFAGWNTAADGSGTSVAAGSMFPSSVSTTLYAAWEPDNTGLTPSFNTNTSDPIGVLASTSYVINTVYTNSANDLVLSQYPDKIQIIATVPSGTLAITTTTNLTLPIGYQTALNTAASTISFIGNLTDVNAALASLKYTAAATAVSTTISIYAAYAGLNGDYRYNPDTGSSYLRNPTTAIWADTYNPTTAASNCGIKFNGMCGYMAVPNTVAESTFLGGMLGSGWIGVIKSSGLKYIDNAPSAIAGTTVSVTNWGAGEGSTAGENNVGMPSTSGKWADLSTQSYNPIYEFGGKSETPLFAALTRTITISALTAPAAPTLDAASDTGTSNSDKITNDNTPTLNIGGLTSGATITLTATPASGPAVTCTFVATTTTGSCTFSTMGDGTYSITATQTLGGTTTAASTALANVKIDATRPTVTLSSSQVVSGGNLTATPGVPTVTATITVTFSESVSGLLISEITKNAESTGWAITTTSFTTAAITTINFVASNATGAGGTAGIAKFSVAEGVASDIAGNTNTATISDFVINTLIQLTLSNEYQQSPLLNPVVGGSGGTITQTTPGQALTMPGQLLLTRVGHTFAGWSLVTTNGSGTVVGATFTPTVPVKLYSSWTPNVYVVTYDANGGNGAPATASQSFNYGGSALTPSAKGTLTRTGYTFAGWSTAPVASGTIYSNSSDSIAGTTTSYTPTGTIILYAKWSANTYAVSFDANGGSGTKANLAIVAGTPLTLTGNASITRTGYTFAGWNTAADGSGTAYANTGSVTAYSNLLLYAQWTPALPGAPTVSATTAGNTTATVTVTGVAASGTTVGPASSYSVQAFASDGTTVITGKTCTVLASASPLSCEITGLTNGTTYKFKATAINTTGSATGVISTVTAIPAPYVVTYALNGGTLVTTTANYNLGTPLTLPLPTKTGYTFAGWNNPSSTLVGIDGGSYSPSASITLTAQWSAITYTVTYNGNGSDGGTVITAGSFAFGNSYSIADKGTMTKSGHTFAGWTTAANGSGTVYANTANLIASSTATYSAAANLNLYAKWTPEVYVITYNANGASGSPSRATDSFTFGSTPITLPDKTGLTYGGYTFGGWSETSTGLAVINPYSPTQSRTLYAVWSGVQYSVTYDVNGGSGSVADATYTTGSTGLTLNNGSGLTRTGYTFGGWKNLAGTTVSGSPYSPTDNVTLYAIWTPVSVAITFNAGTVAGSAPTVTLPSNINAQYSALYTLPAALATVTDGGTPAASYAFAGWAFNGNIYQAGSTYRMTTTAPTFTAQWQKILAVTYVLNGGTLASGDQLYDTDCTFEPVGHQCGLNNLVITLNKAPSRAGFSFAGWSSQGTPSTLIPAETSYTLDDSNYIFYANWTANSYTITFAAGAGSNGNASAITDSYGATVQLAASTGYSVAGSKFIGWLIGSTTYAAGALYVMGTDASPITATAQFANNTFKVFYNTNGATAGATPAATAAVQGASINFDGATGFSRPGFTFEGWSDGTDIRAAGYATTMGSTNTTVIAQWKIAIPQAPTISSVTGSDGGATITVAAASSGGAPSSYLVTASPGGATCTVYAPATSCSISPLTNGTSYTFSATATNSTGTSSGTTSSAVTPAGKPDAPTGVNAVSGNGSATVSFIAPTVTGGPVIASYTVTASPGGASCTVNAPATSCVVSGLANGTAYTFAVTANNGLFTSSASTASSSVVPATVPDAPTSVTATSSTSGSATVAFTAPVSNGGSAITGYRITSSPAGATCVVGSNATTYTCTGLTDGTAYTFGVVAINNVGNSVSATSSSVTTQGAASAPTTISAIAGDGKATVTFSGAVANGSTITGYTVQAYDNTGNAVTGVTCTVTSSATSGSCEVTGLTNGSSYTFKAVTNSTANSTAVSSAPSIATTAITPAKAPDAPSSVQVTAGTGKISVSWTEPASNGSAITSYAVQAYDAAGNAVSGATCTATAPATTCDVSANLVAGTNYTFKVTATSGAGTSAASSASTSIAVNAAPSVPLNVAAVAGNASASVSWDPPANSNGAAITGYTVQAYDSNANAVSGGTCTASTSPCTVPGLTNGSAYTFKVTATNSIGTSLASTASSAVTPSTVPNAPTAVSAAVGDAEATISFTAPANNGGSSVTSYTVTASNGATITGSTSPLTISGLTNGTAYTFTVKATNKNGDSVASAASASVTPIASSIPTLANGAQPTGNPYVGSTLTSAVTFNGAPTPTQTYQWQVCTSPTDLSTCTNISGATSASYVPTITDEGKYIVVVATATNRVGTAVETSTPTLVINPEIAFSAPSPVPGATAGTAYVLSAAAAGGVGTFTYTVVNGALPSGVTLDPATGQIAGTPTTAGTYTFTVRATDSNGVYKDVVITIVVAAASTPAPTPAPTTPVVNPNPAPTCDADCQAAKEAAATKAAADKAAADALAKAAADKASADAAAAAKAAANTAANNASTKAAADAAAAAAAAKAAIDKAAAAAVAQAAADAAAKAAAAQAKAAADAQAIAAKAAADAAAALKNSTATAAAKAAATASANTAAAQAAAAVKAAATAAQQAAQAKTTAANATKQVDIAINSLTSKTAASQASAQANAIAAAAKAAADAAAKEAADAATAAKATATAAQKAASDTAARIATEQKQAATAAALAKVAADAAAKATADKIAAEALATKAAQDLAKVLADKATLAEQAAKTTDETARAEIQKKIEEVTTKVEEVQKSVEAATNKAEAAATVQEAATQNAEAATQEAQTQAAEAVAVKAESVAKTAAATKAVAAASVAAKVATAAKAAAAKVPSKAVITTKPSTSTSKNSATATVTGLKPGQKVKVTVNVKDK